MLCRICKTDSTEFATATVLGKHLVKYFSCAHCGFVQTEPPYWLDDAYSEAISRADVGLIGRNISLYEQAKSIILAFFDYRARFLDYGGGYGMLVRLMRDAGLDFYLYDKYCDNLFAKGFEVRDAKGASYELVTAFEVFEHLIEPLAEIERMRQFSDSILFTTTLIASPPPLPGDWWYYGLEHGQHVAFYSKQTLTYIAGKLRLNLHSDGRFLHLLTPKSISSRRLKTILNPYVGPVARRLLSRRLAGRSLTATDYEQIAGRPLA